jgi:hypothetical protein
MEQTPFSLAPYSSLNRSAVGRYAMDLQDETVGLHRRLTRVRQAMHYVDDPLAITLLQTVIEDIEARIAAIESGRQPQAG